MVVLGADTHKRSNTVAAVAAATGELLDEQTVQVGRRGFDAISRAPMTVGAISRVERRQTISSTASMTNQARWLSGSHSRTSGGIRNTAHDHAR